MTLSPSIKWLILIGSVIVTILFLMPSLTEPSFSRLPQDEIDKLNAMVEKMPSYVKPTSLPEWKTQIIDDMTSYMKEYGDVGYTQKEVAECAVHLDRYIAEINRTEKKGDQKHILATTKTLILALNDLNARCNHGLIETMERENLIEMIFLGAEQTGYAGETDYFNKITNEWREW